MSGVTHWARHTKNDYSKERVKRLVKQMPKAAQQLKEGTLTPEDVTFELTTTYMTEQSCKPSSCVESVSAKLSPLSWPVVLDLSGDEFPQTADVALFQEFASDLEERMITEAGKCMEGHGTSAEDFAAFSAKFPMKMAYEKMCCAWSK